MPTIQGTDDFNHPITAPTYYDTVFGSPASVGTPLYQSQPASLQVPNTGGVIGVRKNLTGTPARPWIAFAFRSESHIASSAVNLAALHPSVGNELRCEYAADGSGGSLTKVYFTGDAGSLKNGPAYTPGTWIWIELIADFSGTTFGGYWRVSGIDQTSTSKTGETGTSANYTQLVTYAGGPTHTWYAAYWNWGSAASTSDWLGEPVPGRQFKRFYGPAQLTGSAATLYTCPTGTRARILHIHSSNPSAAEVDLNLSIGTDAAATRVYDDFPLAADSVEHNYDPYDLAAGDVIQGWASSAGTVVLTVSGYEEPA